MNMGNVHCLNNEEEEDDDEAVEIKNGCKTDKM